MCYIFQNALLENNRRLSVCGFYSDYYYFFFSRCIISIEGPCFSSFAENPQFKNLLSLLKPVNKVLQKKTASLYHHSDVSDSRRV